jgi:ATP-dependent RNA helicase DDX46/PRP5
MFDLGFEQQIVRIIQNIRPDRQTVMFSATFPRQVEAAARKILKNPVEITVHGRSVVSNTIDQIIEVIRDEAKFERLMQLVAQWYSEGMALPLCIFI